MSALPPKADIDWVQRTGSVSCLVSSGCGNFKSSDRGAGHHAQPFHRRHPSRRAELSIPL